MKRTIRDRSVSAQLSLFGLSAKAVIKPEEKPGTVAWQWGIDAKLHHTHKGIGSQALLWGNCIENVTALYDEMFPGRVIMKIFKSGRPWPIEDALKRATEAERKWLMKPVPVSSSETTLKRAVRER